MHKLLIADDEKMIRESIVELIDWNALGIQITASCKNGMEALDAIMDTAPDIVMTDIHMPGLDGLDLIEKIYCLDSRIQFIILTGYPEFDYARRALKYGVREYLLKPISEEVIIEAVNHVKKSLLIYGNPAIGNLVSRLYVIRQEEDSDQAKLLLSRFFIHFTKPEELRHLGLNLLMELQTRLEPPSTDDLSHFTELIMAAQRIEELRSIITNHLLGILYAGCSTKTSLCDAVKAYVTVHLDDENLSLKHIAENLLYINVNYLSRTFTKQSGEKFSNYLNHSRIEKAKKLLHQNGAEHIYAIAEAVGFGSNPQYFSQVFKKYTGSTPSQFAKGK